MTQSAPPPVTHSAPPPVTQPSAPQQKPAKPPPPTTGVSVNKMHAVRTARRLLDDEIFVTTGLFIYPKHTSCLKNCFAFGTDNFLVVAML